jgi:hypothetical protein
MYLIKVYIGEKTSQVRVVMDVDPNRNQQQFVRDLEQ